MALSVETAHSDVLEPYRYLSPVLHSNIATPTPTRVYLALPICRHRQSSHVVYAQAAKHVASITTDHDYKSSMKNNIFQSQLGLVFQAPCLPPSVWCASPTSRMDGSRNHLTVQPYRLAPVLCNARMTAGVRYLLLDWTLIMSPIILSSGFDSPAGVGIAEFRQHLPPCHLLDRSPPTGSTLGSRERVSWLHSDTSLEVVLPRVAG